MVNDTIIKRCFQWQQQESVFTMIKIITIEDDPHLLETLVSQLSLEEDFEVYGASNLSDGKELIKSKDTDLVLLDVVLPDGDGRDMCRWIRTEGYTMPILMLTGQDSEMDTIEGLEAGANDYIAKPLRLGELLARIRSQLRQYQNQENARIKIGAFHFIQGQKTLSHRESGKTLNLTEKEASIIKYLLKKNGDVTPKSELLEQVWGYGDQISTHTLETHIYRLRQKIGFVDEQPFIITKDNGYQLNP